MTFSLDYDEGYWVPLPQESLSGERLDSWVEGVAERTRRTDPTFQTEHLPMLNAAARAMHSRGVGTDSRHTFWFLPPDVVSDTVAVLQHFVTDATEEQILAELMDDAVTATGVQIDDFTCGRDRRGTVVTFAAVAGDELVHQAVFLISTGAGRTVAHVLGTSSIAVTYACDQIPTLLEGVREEAA